MVNFSFPLFSSKTKIPLSHEFPVSAFQLSVFQLFFLDEQNI